MPSARMRRINESLREVVGEAISTELQDPRIGFVTVTSVETAPDLRHARVYVSVLGSEEEREATLEGLAHSHGFLQHALGRELRMKRTPTLEFVHDDSIDRGFRIGEIIEEHDR